MTISSAAENKGLQGIQELSRDIPPERPTCSSLANAHFQLDALLMKMNRKLVNLQETSYIRSIESLQADHSISLNQITQLIKKNASAIHDDQHDQSGSSFITSFLSSVSYFSVFLGTVVNSIKSYVLPQSDDRHTSQQAIIHTINYLAQKNAISVEKRDDIIAFVAQDRMQNGLVELAAALKIETIELSAILEKCLSTAPEKAFKHIETIWILSELFQKNELVPEVLSHAEIKNVSQLCDMEEQSLEKVDILHTLAKNIYIKSKLSVWVDNLPKLLSCEIGSEQIRVCKEAIKAHNPTQLFNALQKSLSELYTVGSEITLEGLFAKELIEKLKKEKGDSFFSALEQEITQEMYLSNSLAQLKNLKKCLKKLINDSAENSHAGLDSANFDMNALLKKLSNLCEGYDDSQKEAHKIVGNCASRLFIPVSQETLSPTYRSAQMGYMVRVMRKINDAQKAVYQKAIHTTPQKKLLDSLRVNRILSPQIENSSLDASRKTIETARKTAHIAFLKCTCGNGHTSYANSVEEALKKASSSPTSKASFSSAQYDVPQELLNEYDLFHTISFGRLNTTQFFNWALKNDKCWLIDLLKTIKNKVLPSNPQRNSYITGEENSILRKLLETGADAVGMFYDFDGKEIETASSALGVPLLHGSTDFDLSSYKKENLNPLYRYLIPSQNHDILQRTLSSELKPEQIEEIGVVVREPFEKPISNEQIIKQKLKLGIDPEATVIMFSSGGGGMVSDLPELLAKANFPHNMKIHIIVVTGNNQEYKDHIEKRICSQIHSSKVKMTATGFLNADEYCSLMSVSDYFCGKPGGSTTAEIIAHNQQRKDADLAPLTFFYDMTSHRFQWEKVNGELTKSLGVGIPVESRSSFVQMFMNELQRDEQPVYTPLFSIEEESDQLNSKTKRAQGARVYPEMFEQLIERGKEDQVISSKKKRWKQMIEKQALFSQSNTLAKI